MITIYSGIREKMKRGRPRIISDEIVQQILTTYIKGEVGYKETAKRLQLPLETVKYYIRKYKA